MITIGIINYNKDQYLNKCLESIKTFIPKGSFDVIIVDDNSNDNSKNILQSFNYNVIHNSTNKGASYSRNVILNECKTEYVLFLDSDDYLIGTPCIRAKNDLIVSDYIVNSHKNLDMKVDNIPYKKICQISSYMFNMEFLNNNNLSFYEKTKRLEDYIFICKVYNKRPIISKQEEIYFTYNKNKEGKSRYNTLHEKENIKDKYLYGF